jgi:hypothetical protein
VNDFTTAPPAILTDNVAVHARLDRIEALVVAIVDEFVKHLATAETTPRAARRASNRDGGGRTRQNWRN